MTLTQFLVAHRACLEGHKRAKEFTSLEDAWQNCLPRDLVWAATRPGVLTGKELQRFAVFCARSVQHLMTDPRSRNAVEVAERYVQGKATRKELSAASRDARAAYNASSAFTAAAAAAAARRQQAAWLRQNTTPNFN